jgi:Raf kinase inhibitor-like YbhB/YbcL family protein
MTLSLTSPAFSDGGPIPRAHTCDGADLSPPLVWSGVPAGCKQLALIMDDPDAPGKTFVHWVLYALAPDVKGLASGFPRDAETVKPAAARQGVNDLPAMGYGGPCPPPGPAHRYIFTLYALDAEVTLPPGATKAVLLSALQGHTLGEARLTGKYGRRQG